MEYQNKESKEVTEKRKPGRRADGLIARHFRYTDLHGISRRKTVYGKTKAEVDRKKRDFLAMVDMALRVDEQGKTVADWVDEWLEVYKKPTVTIRTFATYKRDGDLIKQALGNRMQ
jgi:hypothetical protein